MDFKQFYHPVLEKDCKQNLSTKEIIVNDRMKSGRLVRYSKKEIDIITSGGGKIDKTIHNVKKVFEGVLV